MESGFRSSRGSLVTALFVSLLASSSLATAQDADKVTLRIKGEVGQVARYESETNVTISVAGQELNIVEKSKSETRVTGSDASGVLMEQETLEQSTTVNGNEMPTPPGGMDADPTILKLAPNGKVLQYEPANADPEDPNDNLNIRLLLSTNMMFSDNPVGPGDTWTFDLPGDDELGSKNANASFVFEEWEDLDGVRVARIQMTFTETSGSPALSAKSTHWVDPVSGDSIKSSYVAEGIDLSMGGQEAIAKATGTGFLTSGGMVKQEGQEEVPEDEPKDEIAEQTEDFEKIDGVFTIYRRDNEGRMTLYMELAPEQFGKLVMLQTTASTGLADGTLAAGDPVNDLLFQFERTPNKRVVMKVANTKFRAKPGTAMADVVERSFPDSIVESYAIEAEQDGRVLIDISSLFTSDISMISSMLQGGGNPLLGGGGGLMPDRANTYVKTLKNFPDNVYVETMYNFAGRGGGGGGLAALLGGAMDTKADPRSAVIQLNYNLFLVPEDSGYRPRFFDPRVGFFTVEYQDFNDDTALFSTKQFISRWHLEKVDPSAAVSDVKEPIVYWIDAAVPEEYRAAVKAGIEAWNGPFEKAGFRNAVVAKQMESVDQFDHADMRYNVVRWITSPGDAYAIALFRVHPVTGQILNTSVSVDSNIVKAFASEYGDFIRPEAVASQVLERLNANGHHDCEVCKLAQSNLAVGDLAIRALGQQAGISRDEYIRQFVHWLVMHEVGHTLGLRHNFAASNELSMAQLGNAELVNEKGTSSSVMDYIAFNPSALTNPGVKFYGDTPGVYDYWAIEYGYKEIPSANTPEEELFELKKHASMTNQPGLRFLGDEFADSFDPYVTRFDLAADPLNYWMTMGTLSKDLIMKLDEYSPKPGQSFSWFRRDFNALMNEYSKVTSQLGRFIGGTRRNPNFKGDPGEQMPMVAVDGADQRQALDQIVKMALVPGAVDIPKHYFQMFQPEQDGGVITSVLTGQDDFPTYDMISGYQASVLNSLMGSAKLTALLNQEFEAVDPTQTLTAREVFNKVTTAVWSELDSTQPVTILRRQLQRNHLNQLIAMTLDKNGAPQEARALAYTHLWVLQQSLESKASSVAHESTKVHWLDSLMRINRALGATETVGASGGGGGELSLADLLGG